MTPEQVEEWLNEFQDKTGAVIRWQLVESSYGGGSSAITGLTEFLADKINGKQEFFEVD